MAQRTATAGVRGFTDPFATTLAQPEPPPAEHSSDSLQGEQVRLLYSNLPSSIAVSALLAAILVAVQASVIAPERLIGWSAALAGILLIRACLLIAWKRQTVHFGSNSSRPINTAQCLRRFRITTIMTGIVWGVGGALLVPSGDVGHKLYVAFVLAGLCAGAATTLAVDRISVGGFLPPVLLPQGVFLASEGDTVSFGMSGMIVLFLLFLMISARQSRHQLEDNHRLRAKATENGLQLHKMLETSPIATRIADATTHRVVFANPSYVELIESSPEAVLGVIPSKYYVQTDDYHDVLVELSRGGQVVNKLVEVRPLRGGGKRKWVLASYFEIEYQNQSAILGWFYDITERKIKEDRAEHLALHDHLTGLPNRAYFLDRLKQEIVHSAREKGRLALLFVDLDGLKSINDRHGHNIGDQLLQETAKRIQSCVHRKAGSVARLGGDEFVILLPSIRNEQGAVEVAEHIWLTLSSFFLCGGLTLSFSSSIGVALYPEHATEGDQLVQCADWAMYHAKSEGGDCVRVYRPGMGDSQDPERS